MSHRKCAFLLKSDSLKVPQHLERTVPSAPRYLEPVLVGAWESANNR